MDKVQREQQRFIKLLKAECGEQLGLIRAYHEYLTDFYEKHKDKIIAIENKLKANDHKVAEILGDFNLVEFIDKDDKLMLRATIDGEKVIISIDSIRNIAGGIKSRKESIKVLETFLQENYERLYNVVKHEQEIIDEMKSIKPGVPKKKFGVFVTAEAKQKVQTAYENRLKKPMHQLEEINDEKKNIVFNCEANERIINRFKKVNEFVSKLTEPQRQQILSYYDQIKVYYDENDVYDDKLKYIKSGTLTLSQFVKKRTKENPKWVMLPLMKYIILLYKSIPADERDSHLESILSKIDFGEYKNEIETLINSMTSYEFGSVSKGALRQFESEYLRAKKKEEAKKASGKNDDHTSEKGR